jgi:hypothetical protein
MAGYSSRVTQQFGPRGGKKGYSQTTGFDLAITGAIFAFLGWLLFAGILGWSSQMRWLALIFLGIWWLSR